MIWLVWRRQRVPLLVALGLVAAVAVVALVGRPVALAVLEDIGATRCLQPGSESAACTDVPGWGEWFAA